MTTATLASVSDSQLSDIEFYVQHAYCPATGHRQHTVYGAYHVNGAIYVQYGPANGGQPTRIGRWSTYIRDADTDQEAVNFDEVGTIEANGVTLWTDDDAKEDHTDALGPDVLPAGFVRLTDSPIFTDGPRTVLMFDRVTQRVGRWRVGSYSHQWERWRLVKGAETINVWDDTWESSDGRYIGVRVDNPDDLESLLRESLFPTPKE